MKTNSVLLQLQNIATACEVMHHIQHTPYGFTFFCFETDRFGGCFLQVTVDGDGTIRNTDDQRTMTLDEVRRAVPELRDELLKHRNMAHICELINAEYD